MSDAPGADGGTGEGAWELTTVADDLAVAFRGTEVRRYEGLEPGTAYERDGLTFTTLPRPPGERLATVATVNDVHFGEEAAGIISGSDIGPVLRSGPGEAPYPELMNRAAAVEMAAAAPDLVVAKGDLTSGGTDEEHRAFLDCYGATFGERLRAVRGNHDVCGSHTFADDPVQEVELPGVVVAILDTTVAGRAHGHLDADQLAWLDELGARADRPVLVQVLDQLRPGDTLIVWKLDRLGRSLRHLVDVVTGLADRGVGFRSLQESIDTTTPGGKLVFHVFAALAEFERDLIRERTTAGLAAARARGRNGGRPPVLDAGQVELARELYASRRYTTAEIARRLKVGRSTLYRYLTQE